MYLYVLAGWSVSTFRRNHSNEEVFEFLGKILLSEGSEVLIVAFIPEKVVVVVIFSCKVEGLSSSDNAEHDDSKREDVSLHSIVRFLL